MSQPWNSVPHFGKIKTKGGFGGAGGTSESERIRGAATIRRLLESLTLTYVPDVPGKDELAINPRGSD